MFPSAIYVVVTTDAALAVCGMIMIFESGPQFGAVTTVVVAGVVARVNVPVALDRPKYRSRID